jgi:lysophospholipase L1-like esterase
VLTVRDGIPAFAARLAAGDALTVVAFGTSITLFGEYLTHVPAAFVSAAPQARVRFVNRGLRGFITLWGAFRVRDDVLPEVPDLVFIEFAHNDITDDAVHAIPNSLDGMIAQIRGVNPACEFVFVYLATNGAAANGPSPAMRAYEETADYYGFPSIDVATLTEAVIASGAASWNGEAGPALTFDGTHHNPIAADLLGKPFAAALLELIAASAPLRQPAAVRPIRSPFFAGAYREPASRYLAGGEWATGVPHNHDARNAEAYGLDVAQAMAPGATLRLHFEGELAHIWAMGNGTLSIAIAGDPQPYTAPVTSGEQWNFVALVPLLPPGHHVVEVRVTALPVVFGDVFFSGERALGG